MSTRFTAKVIAARTLPEGTAVYLAADDRWNADPGKAERIEDEAIAELRLLDALQHPERVGQVALVEAPALRECAARPGPAALAGGSAVRRHEASGGVVALSSSA